MREICYFLLLLLLLCSAAHIRSFIIATFVGEKKKPPNYVLHRFVTLGGVRTSQWTSQLKEVFSTCDIWSLFNCHYVWRVIGMCHANDGVISALPIDSHRILINIYFCSCGSSVAHTPIDSRSRSKLRVFMYRYRLSIRQCGKPYGP